MKMKKYIPLVFLLAGCGAMKALGLADAEGNPTEAAQGVSDVVQGLTGINAIGLWKAGETLFTGRGRDNLKNVFKSESGWKGAAGSISSILFGTHTPGEAKADGE